MLKFARHWAESVLAISSSTRAAIVPFAGLLIITDPCIAAVTSRESTGIPQAGEPYEANQSGDRPPKVALADADQPDLHPEQLLALFVDTGAAGPATSMDELDLVLGQRQIFSDLRTLQNRINDTQRPTANAIVRYSSQSDDLEIRQVELAQDLFFAQGRSELRLGLQANQYNPKTGAGVKQYAVGATGNHKISDFAAVSGELWLNQLRYRSNDDTKATYDVFVTLRPTDTVRIDLSTNRRLFDNINSLRLGLTTTSYGGSIDFTPMDDLRLTARAVYGSYSDGNRRRTEEVEGIWRIRSQPVIEVGLRGMNFHFSQLLSSGYFNPRNYYSGEGMFRVKGDLTEKLSLQFAASAGLEKSNPGGTKPLVKASIQAAYQLSKRWSVDAEVSHFSSRQSTSSGFARTSALLGLHYHF